MRPGSYTQLVINMMFYSGGGEKKKEEEDKLDFSIFLRETEKSNPNLNWDINGLKV